MQLLTSLVFNRARIMLQSLDVPLQRLVLALQAVQLVIQALRILPLLLIRGKTVLPKDDVVSHRQRKQSSSSRRYLPPAHLASFIQTHDRPRLFYLRARIIRTSHLP